MVPDIEVMARTKALLKGSKAVADSAEENVEIEQRVDDLNN